MTSHEWLTTGDAQAMLNVLFPVRGLDSADPQPRKSRLYLIACARRVRDQLPGPCRVITVLAERIYAGQKMDCELRAKARPHADELFSSRGDVRRLREIGDAMVGDQLATAEEVQTPGTVPAALLPGAAMLVYSPFAPLVPSYHLIPTAFHSANLVREAFGVLPPRAPLPSPFDPQWRTERVMDMAREALVDLSVLPYLADALQDEGCSREDVLEHLRKPGIPHVRECWALQLVLGYEDDRPWNRPVVRSFPK